MVKKQPLVVNGLDEREALYIKYVIEGATPKYAARRAGYQSPEREMYRLQAIPRVRVALQMALNLQFQTEDAPAARKVVRDLMDDRKTPAKLRLDCARLLLNRGGFPEVKARAEGNDRVKTPSEMTGAELQAHIAKLQGEIGTRSTGASVIMGDYIEVSDTLSTQALDILG